MKNSDLPDLGMFNKLRMYIYNYLWISLSYNYFSKNKELVKLTDSQWRFTQEKSSSLRRMRFPDKILQQITIQPKKNEQE